MSVILPRGSGRNAPAEAGPAGGCHGPSRAPGREAAEKAIRDFPAIVAGVKEQRACLARAVRYLLELLPPGVVQLHHWHPEAAPEEGKLGPAYCGLARKS